MEPGDWLKKNTFAALLERGRNKVTILAALFCLSLRCSSVF